MTENCEPRVIKPKWGWQSLYQSQRSISRFAPHQVLTRGAVATNAAQTFKVFLCATRPATPLELAKGPLPTLRTGYEKITTTARFRPIKMVLRALGSRGRIFNKKSTALECGALSMAIAH